MNASRCEHYEAARTRWVDGVAEAAEGLDLRLHLDACPACADDVARQAEVRQALRASADELRGAAPEHLRQRVADLVAGAAARPAAHVLPMPARPAARGRLVWRWIPRSAAAAVLLAVAGVVAVGALAPRGGVLAAQLALDHLKCLVVAPTSPRVVAEDVERQWAAQRGWSITVAPSTEEHGLRLVGLRTCLYHDGHMAHVLYERDGERVSLFVMPHREGAAASLDVLGQQTRTWSHDGRTYALVTDRAAGEVDQLAAYFAAHAR